MRDFTERDLLNLNNLDESEKYVIIKFVDAIGRTNDMKNKEYLKMHPYAISCGNDGYYRTYLPLLNGKRKQIKKKKLEDLEAVIIDYWKNNSTTSFKERYKVWIERQKNKGVSDNTVYKYKTDYNRFFKDSEIENKDINTIDADYLNTFINHLLTEKEIPYRALKGMFGYMKGIFDKAIKDGLIKSNPCDRVDLPLFQKKCKQQMLKGTEERTFSQDEKKTLLADLQQKYEATPNYIVPYAVELALLTGMRVGELSGLMWEDIDYKHRVINIRHSEKRNRLTNEYSISTPKNGKIRIFPLTEEIHNLLKRIKAVETKFGYLTEYVFSNENGRIHARVISDYAKHRTARKEFTNTKSIHTARRTLNSELIASGVPREACCAMIGNTERVNEQYYTYDMSSIDYKMQMVSKANKQLIAQG